MDSETGFLFSHAIACGKNREELAKITNSYEEYQKACKAYAKPMANLGNTDIVFCGIAIGKYLELEAKLRSVLGDNFSKTIKAYKNKADSLLSVKECLNSSSLTKEEIKELFPMLQEFI